MLETATRIALSRRCLGAQLSEEFEADSIDAAEVVDQGDCADPGRRHETDEGAEAAGAVDESLWGVVAKAARQPRQAGMLQQTPSN